MEKRRKRSALSLALGSPILAAFLAAAPAGTQTVGGAAKATIPLCPGLTIVTAVSQPTGDYESIKRIESVTAEGVRIRYSSYMPDPKGDYETTTVAHPPWVPFVVYRTVRTVDVESSALYLQVFQPVAIPETVRGTTALGISRKTFRELREKGKSAFSISQAVHPAFPIDESGRDAPFLLGEPARVDPTPVMIPVLVNDRPTSLPALRARGQFVFDDAEFYFLYDESNPITLKFRIGIAPPLTPEWEKIFKEGHAQELKRQFEDRDVLRVVKITYRCEDPSLALKAGGGGNAPNTPAGGVDGGAAARGGGGGGAATAGGAGLGGAGGGTGGRGAAGGGSGTTEAALEDSLARTGRAEVYSIYFAFNRDEIREESEPTLQEIANVLLRHPDWKLSIEGHTDSIASDSFNLELSRKRAAAVQDALTRRYRIDPKRLTAAGHGESRPKGTNDTLEGRARNRRVELIKSGS